MTRKLVPPPIRCGGTARSTGRPCAHYASPGSRFCWLHGSRNGRTGRAAAEARNDTAATVATVLERDPRPAEQVLADCLRGADAILTADIEAVRAGGAISAADLVRLSESIRFAASIAGSHIMVRTAERRVALEEQTAELFVAYVRAVLDADELALTLAQRRTGETVAARVLRALPAGPTSGPAARPSRHAAPGGRAGGTTAAVRVEQVEPEAEAVDAELVEDDVPEVQPVDVVPVPEPDDAQLVEPVDVPEQVVRQPSQVDAASDTTQPAERRDRLGRRRIPGEEIVRERAGGWPL